VRGTELFAPPLHLAGEVAFGAAEVREADGRRVDGVEGGEDVDLGDWHLGVAQSGHHAVLAGHIVGGRQHVAQRRPTHDPGHGAVTDLIGEVGFTVGDNPGRKFAVVTRYMRTEPDGQSLQVKACDVAHLLVPLPGMSPASQASARIVDELAELAMPAGAVGKPRGS